MIPEGASGTLQPCMWTQLASRQGTDLILALCGRRLPHTWSSWRTLFLWCASLQHSSPMASGTCRARHPCPPPSAPSTLPACAACMPTCCSGAPPPLPPRPDWPSSRLVPDGSCVIITSSPREVVMSALAAGASTCSHASDRTTCMPSRRCCSCHEMSRGPCFECALLCLELHLSSEVPCQCTEPAWHVFTHSFGMHCRPACWYLTAVLLHMCSNRTAVVSPYLQQVEKHVLDHLKPGDALPVSTAQVRQLYNPACTCQRQALEVAISMPRQHPHALPSLSGKQAHGRSTRV